jgi:nitrate reductase gamma subunit
MSQWLRSSKASTLFLYSAWIVVCMGVFVIFMLTPWFQQIEALPKGEISLRVLGGAIGVVGSLASLIILFGMAVFCAREDRSTISSKILWFILFFATACFGAAAYFFTVYRKQVQGMSTPATNGD